MFVILLTQAYLHFQKILLLMHIFKVFLLIYIFGLHSVLNSAVSFTNVANYAYFQYRYSQTTDNTLQKM